MNKKILHLNFSDDGGAGIAVKRISDCLLKLNIDSKILVAEKNTQDKNVIHNQSSFNRFLHLVHILFSIFFSIIKITSFYIYKRSTSSLAINIRISTSDISLSNKSLYKRSVATLFFKISFAVSICFRGNSNFSSYFFLILSFSEDGLNRPKC